MAGSPDISMWRNRAWNYRLALEGGAQLEDVKNVNPVRAPLAVLTNLNIEEQRDWHRRMEIGRPSQEVVVFVMKGDK